MWIIEVACCQAKSDAGPIFPACTGIHASDRPDPCVRYLLGLEMQRWSNSEQLADTPHFSRGVSVRSQRLSVPVTWGRFHTAVLQLSPVCLQRN